MHVVLMGARPEAVHALLAGGHEITLLYEGWEEKRIVALGDRVPRSCVVDSPDILDSVWSALHHVGATSMGIDVVVAVAEYGVLPAAVLARHFGARSLDPEVALRCRDKAVQKEVWRAAGVPTANWVVVLDARIGPDSVLDAVAAAGLKGPFVVKPPAGAGGIQVAAAGDEHELAKLAREHPSRRLVIEERNDGREWHFDGVVQGGKLTAFLVSPYLTPLIETKNGRPQCSIALLPHEHPELYAEAADLTDRALAAVGLTDGVFHFEVFGEPTNFVAGELAARPGGSRIGSVIKRTIGVDVWAAATQIFTGEEIERIDGSSGNTFGYTHLPSVPRRRNRVKRDDLERMPGVIEVQMAVAFDETMPDMRRSTSTGVGIVVVEGSDFPTCQSLMADVVNEVVAINSAAE
jgi:hypothetical protein